MKNILVSIDFEKQTGVLVDRAIELATKFNSKLWLVHIAAPDPDFVSYEVGPQNVRDVRAQELKYERKLLEDFTNKLIEQGVNAQGILIEGPTVQTLLSTVKRLNIDLVIMGHHKRNLFYKAFVGNTDMALLNKTNVPVLVIPLQTGYSTASFFETAEETIEN